MRLERQNENICKEKTVSPIRNLNIHYRNKSKIMYKSQ